MEQAGVSLVAENAAEYFSILDRVEASGRQLAASLSSAVSAINALDDKAGAAARSSAALGNETADAAKDAALMGRATDTAANELDAYGTAATDTAGDLKRLGTAEAGAASDTDRLGAASTQGARGLDVVKEAAVGAARKLGEFAVEGAQQAAQAVLQFAVDGVKAAGDFEAGMNNFAAVTGDSLDESGQSLGEFKDLFIQLGRDLPVSTTEVQQAAIEMAKGGIEPATIAAGGLKQTLQFAAASGLGLADAANIAAKAVGGWTAVTATAQEKADFLTHATDLMARSANAATVDVDELALGLFNSQGAAKAAGVTFDDTVTTLALVSARFASSSTAGTSFANFLARIQPATAPASEAMAKLGLLTEQGTSRFYDQQGAFIGVRNASELLKKATDGLSDAEKSSALQTIFGNDAKGVAVALAEGGAAAYDKMAASIAKQASLEEQAALKQQGFNVALDNMGGSLEALQITVASATLPTLTRLINTVSSGINVITDFASATEQGDTWLATLAGTVQTIAIPALIGATVATVAYGLANSASLTPALIASLAKIGLQTEALIANTGAALLAAAPYIVIAAAIGGVVLAYNDFNAKAADATTQLLESRTWWTESTTAINDYATATGKAKTELEPYASTIKALRDEIQKETEDLGKRSAAGLVGQAQYDAEAGKINALAGQMRLSTTAYNEQEQALVAQQSASMTATARTAELEGGMQDVGKQAGLTADDIAKLGKAIEDNFKKGQVAVQAYATTYSEFTTGVESRSADHAAKMTALEAEKQKATTDEQRTGIDTRIQAEKTAYATTEENAAQSYARQQAAQQQHLGQMLIDYTVSQATLGNIAKDKAAEITSALEKEYGLQETSVATTYLHMTSSIDAFAGGAHGNIQGLVTDLRDQQTQAGETQKSLDEYAKEYVATQTNNFVEGKEKADDYIDSLNRIPSQVDTTVTTHYRTEGEHGGNGAPGAGGGNEGSGGRASGGHVNAGQSYLVGEQGFEMFTPRQDGEILSHHELQQALASPAQMASASAGNVYAPTTIINVDARGSNLSEADITRGVQAGFAASASRADSRIRMDNAYV